MADFWTIPQRLNLEIQRRIDVFNFPQTNVEITRKHPTEERWWVLRLPKCEVDVIDKMYWFPDIRRKVRIWEADY